MDADSGNAPVGAGSYLSIGLSGALLAELMLAGSLTVTHGRVVPVGMRPADPLLGEVWEVFSSASPGAKTKSAVRRLDKQLGGVRRRLTSRLVAAGALAEATHRRSRRTRHRVIDGTTHERVLKDVRAAAAADDPLEPRLAVLLALAGPCRLLERVAPDRSGRRHAKSRIKDATAQAPIAPEVKKLIDELITATAAAATVAATASSN